MATLRFDHNRFGDLMIQRKDIKVHDTKKHGWNERDDQAMHYKGGDYEYRTWRHDVSLCRGGGAILVSCKIDQRRSDFHHDDHMILLASVAADTTTLTVQAALQSVHQGVTGQTDLVVHAAGVDTSVALKNAVTKAIDKMMNEKGKKHDGGYSYLADIAYTNIQCLAASCVRS